MNYQSIAGLLLMVASFLILYAGLDSEKEKQKDHPVILGEFGSAIDANDRMDLGIRMGYEFVESVKRMRDGGECIVVIGHTTTKGFKWDALGTMTKFQPHSLR